MAINNSSAFIKNLKQLFSECDTDGNGSLGRQEFSELCSKIGLNKEAANETFDRLDIDKNDRITFDEFTAGFNQYKQTSQSPNVSPQPSKVQSSPTVAAATDNGSGTNSPTTTPATSNPSRFLPPSPTDSSAAISSPPSSPQPPQSLGKPRPAPDCASTSSTPSPTARRSPNGGAGGRIGGSGGAGQKNLVSSMARGKNVSPLGVLSLGSTASSCGSGSLVGNGTGRSSSSGADVSQSFSEASNSVEATETYHPRNTTTNNEPSVVVYSSEAIGDCEQTSNSGQFGSLISSNGAGGGGGSFNQFRTMQDLLECVQKLQSENQILTQIFFKDKREREEYISQLGEEFDQQVREVEERAHRRAREELESEKKRLRDMMQAERETLQNHYQTIEKMSKLIKSTTDGKLEDGESIDQVKSKLEDTFLENRQLKKSLLDTKSDVAMIWKEMERLKQQYEDKLSSAYERNNETRSECDHIKQQLTLMKDSNRKLQDASDVITNYITEKVDPVIKGAGGSGDEDLDHLGPCGGSLGTHRLGVQGGNHGCRKGSLLSQYINGTSQPISMDCSVISGESESFNISQSLPTNKTGGDDEGKLSAANSSTTGNNNAQKIYNFTGSKLTDLDSSDRQTSIDSRSERDTPESCKQHEGSDYFPSHNEATGKKANDNSITSGDQSSLDSRHVSSRKDQRHHGSSINSAPTSSKSVRTTRELGRICSISKSEAPERTRDYHSKLSRFKSLSLDLVGEDSPSVEPADGPSRATFNIILVGDSFVGKSSFATRFMEGSFVQGLISNCSIDFKTKAYKVDGVNYTVNLWDTAGQERFRSITASYFRKADGIILMYDVTEKRSYLNVRNWMSTIADTASENVAVLLVGNKIDLRRRDNKDKCVPAKEGYRLAREYGIVFLETSVKTGTNLVPSMGKLIRLIAKNNLPAEEDDDRIKLNDKGRKFNCMPNKC